MQENVTGIVVKTFAAGSNKVCILTKELGKIVVFVPKDAMLIRVHIGSVIACDATEDGHDSYFARSIALISQPQVLLHDLIWLHHLLEVCYFFSPSREPAEALHTLLANCLRLFEIQKEDMATWRAIKKSLIGSLLMQFGFYPPIPYQNTLGGIQKMLTATVDFTEQHNLELLKCLAAQFMQPNISDYKHWLLTSIKVHPRISGFKTLPFVYKTKGDAREKDI